MLTEGAASEAQFLSKLGGWSNPEALANHLKDLQDAGKWEGAISRTHSML
jgi:hypothetical protein